MQKKFAFSLFCLLSIFTSCKKEYRDGFTSLVDMEENAGDEICPGGGVIIKSGLDKNRNNVLDSAEVDNTKYVCNGNNDKLILLSIDNAGGNTSSTTPIINGYRIKFNKLNYVGVDSITFISKNYVANTTNTAIIELYNVTDAVPISNSQVTSNELYDNMTFKETGNLYNNLPNKEITLGVRWWSSINEQFAGFTSHYLAIYKK